MYSLGSLWPGIELTTRNKDIAFTYIDSDVPVGQEIHGTIKVNYSGRYDSVVINSQIQNSNDIFNFISLNGKKINYPYSRLAIMKDDSENSTSLEFVAETGHVPIGIFSTAKFRATIIQEHKEIASDVIYIRLIRTP